MRNSEEDREWQKMGKSATVAERTFLRDLSVSVLRLKGVVAFH